MKVRIRVTRKVIDTIVVKVNAVEARQHLGIGPKEYNDDPDGAIYDYLEDIAIEELAEGVAHEERHDTDHGEEEFEFLDLIERNA